LVEPTRVVFGNIQYGEIIYAIALVVISIMVYAFIRRYKMWHLGKADSRLKGSLKERWKSFIKTAMIDGIIHRKFVAVFENMGHRPMRFLDLKPKEFFPGIAHFLIAIGCIFLLIGTAMDVISHYVYDFIKGNVYFAHSLFSDIGGLMALAGVILVFIRRYIQKPERLDNRREDLIALLAIILIILTGFIVEGFRIAATELPLHPDWSRWSLGGFLVANILINIDHNSLLILHRIWWWLHSALTFAALLYIALNFNRLWHIIVSPLNVFWRNLGSRGAMVPIDMEKARSYGVAKVEDYTWKNLLDLDACTRCGRCADNCPAKISGKPLSPKKVIQDLKGNLLEKAPVLLAARAKKGQKTDAQIQDTKGQTDPLNPAADETDAKPMIGGVIETEAIWNCTTCFACQEVCPVWAEPMIKIGEMRRNLVLEQASVPETAEGALRSIEDRGHPWRGTMLTRTGWYEGTGVKSIAEESNVDLLYWVGCTEALEDRSLKVAQATAKLLKIAGVRFGVLGSEESCCGDPARRLGNEYLYQMQVMKNIEKLKGYNIKKIVTGCPHCFNNLKNEYPQFGGDFEVIHHSDYILQLLEEGRLKISKGPRGLITYHDACYLGRYNNVYEIPRRILNYVPDLTLVEMLKNRERAFCCGAGGGHMWLEEQKVGERINVMRTVQALATGANIVATGCPYCLQMFQDGIKTKEAEETMKVMDIAEILAESAVYPGQPSERA
jgi:Fe-S oxidoreductase/nitrate reductase gamma subunit